MSTPSPYEPRPQEHLPASPSHESARTDRADNDKLIAKPSKILPAAPAARAETGGAQWSNFPELGESHLGRPRRRVMLPIVLFVATCLSTFWVGAANWRPQTIDTSQILAKASANWQQGLVYMGAVLAILLTHEMGHFLQTVRYGIPASYPLCIPVPFTPIGTMGAVISMDGMRANRKQIFDIGLAGPLAGLVVAAPILYIGVKNLDLKIAAGATDMQLYNPVIVRWMIEWVHPEWADRASWVSISQLNPFFMAGWVGMLITGLNMLPVSQLDGGHTIYGLFGRDAYKIARAFTIVAIVYVVMYMEQAAIWTPMLILVILLGIHHPPTADDNVELDDFRWILGVASMAIPVLCFPLQAIKQ
jgi:membrane-associated protease RseP (regulator of RpoE activity)